MTESTPETDPKAAKPAAAEGAPTSEQPVEEWKPEPRQWTWKDLFTAPMLAFKPKCMLIMAVTAIVIGLWFKIQPGPNIFGESTPLFVGGTLAYLWTAVALVIFSLAATLVATFMKADLLDDEFLTFSEALTQWKGRILSAILVPVFLMGIYGAFIALLALCQLIGSIPVVGTTLYALLYPLGVLLALFIVLLGIAVALAIFVFPSIIAIRKHGWFDNVVDTFEAVGTKPHVLVGSAILTAILLAVASHITFGSMETLQQTTRYMPGSQLAAVEIKADQVRNKAINWVNPTLGIAEIAGAFVSEAGPATAAFTYRGGHWSEAEKIEGYNAVTGTITGIWKIIFSAIFFGYLANLFIGGGMLTYLAVREDDYWDDEDLEDLDKLAKELEDEAKAEAAKTGADAPKPVDAPTTAAEEPKPVEPATPAAPAPEGPEGTTTEKPPEPPKAD